MRGARGGVDRFQSIKVRGSKYRYGRAARRSWSDLAPLVLHPGAARRQSATRRLRRRRAGRGRWQVSSSAKKCPPS
jgi:hypothetical protein